LALATPRGRVWEEEPARVRRDEFGQAGSSSRQMVNLTSQPASVIAPSHKHVERVLLHGSIAQSRRGGPAQDVRARVDVRVDLRVDPDRVHTRGGGGQRGSWPCGSEP
jgi:hypothetical protein